MQANLKISFAKANPNEVQHTKIELINQDNCNDRNFPWKYLELVLINLILIILGKNRRRYNKEFHTSRRVRLSLRGKKIIISQVFLPKLWYIGQTYTIPKYIKREIERIYVFLWNAKKIQPRRHLARLSI